MGFGGHSAADLFGDPGSTFGEPRCYATDIDHRHTLPIYVGGDAEFREAMAVENGAVDDS